MDITLEQWDAAFNSQAKAFLVAVREAVAFMGDGGRIFAITYCGGEPYWWAAAVGWRTGREVDARERPSVASDCPAERRVG